MMLARVSASLRVLVFALLAVAAVLALASPVVAEALTADIFTYDEPVDVAPGSTAESPGLVAPATQLERVVAPDAGSLGHLYDSPSSFVAPRVTDDLVDLVSPSRRHHILDGEVRPNGTYGGGQRAGTGYPGKSEFPARWSDEQIMHHVSDIATDPLSTTVRTQGRDVFVAGTRDGIDIEVLIRNGEIWTAYPTNVPRNPR